MSLASATMWPASSVAAPPLSFDIPRSILSDALAAFARQSGRQLLFSPGEVRGRTAAPVHGRLDPDRALAMLLAGSGFRVLKSSYWNTLLFPLMLIHRLLERSDAAAESDVRDYPPWLDRLFSLALAAERLAIGAGVSLPFGGSFIVVAERNG